MEPICRGPIGNLNSTWGSSRHIGMGNKQSGRRLSIQTRYIATMNNMKMTKTWNWNLIWQL